MLQSASVQDGRPRSISLTNDALGQALRRDEADNTASTGDPHELWYRFNGKQIGYIGNNDTDNIGYAASLQRRVTANVAGPFKNGQTYGAGVVEFDQAYDAINSYQQGAGGGSYTVRDGDSLSGIAAQLWGDAGLWYKLAQANGLSGDAGLAAGQTLSVPAGVVRSSNNAGTFRPYDVSQAYGDSSPTTPSPQAGRKNKCGAFGQILLIAISVAVTAILPGSGTILGAAINGAITSTVTQGAGVVLGIQDKIDWKGVALAGLTAGVTAGISGSGLVSGIKNTFVQGAVSGALASAVTQGIGVATGLQSKFDWAGVAAAGIGAGVGQALGGPIAKLNLGKVGTTLATTTARGLANAATRSLVNGTDFGDNLMAALPDIIGQTVGSWAADRIQSHDAAANEESAALEGASTAYTASLELPLSTFDPADLGRSSSAAMFSIANPFDTPLTLQPVLNGQTYLRLPSDSSIADWLEKSEGIKIDLDLAGRIISASGKVARGGILTYALSGSPTGGVSYVPIYGTGAYISYASEMHVPSQVLSVVNENGDRIGSLVPTGLSDGANNYPNLYLVQNDVGALTTLTGPASVEGADAVVIRALPGGDLRVGFAVSIGSTAEAEIYNDGIARGWDSGKINTEIARERSNPRDPDEVFRIGDLRYVFGKVFNSGRLTKGGGGWFKDGAGIPSQVGAALGGRTYSSVNSMRRAIYRAIAADPELAASFGRDALLRMSRGSAPLARLGVQVGGRRSFELDHIKDIQHGGAVYDLSNLRFVTPKTHINKYKR